MRERQKFHVSMQGNVDVSSNASHSAGLLPRGRKTSCVRRIAVEETRRKIDRHLVGRSYTLVHTHARNTRARAYTLLMPVLYRRCEYANRHACVHALSRSREADSRAVAITRGR